MDDLDLLYKRTMESLKLLALPYSEQKRCFEDYVDVPFEVLDVYDNAFLQLPKLVEADKFSNIQIAEFIRLHNIINFAVGNPDLKDLDEVKFESHHTWNGIREQSRKLLKLLEEPIEVSNKRHI